MPLTSRSLRSGLLDGLRLVRVLDQDPMRKSANLLVEFHERAEDGSKIVEPGVLIIEKTHFSDYFYRRLCGASMASEADEARAAIATEDEIARGAFERGAVDSDASSLPSTEGDDVLAALDVLGQNDVYTWLLAWLERSPLNANDADLKMTLIRPATQTHIEKYSAQRKVMVYETPEMYAYKVQPWIASFPPSRIQWVYNILEHKKEAESILFEDPDAETGFIIVPDLKWDQKTSSSLYIQAIVHNRQLTSLRDLTKDHIGLLQNIKHQASKVAFEKFGLSGVREGTPDGNVRCFLHYHPSYYHLHVHILAASFTSHPGAVVGQAHLLDDVIDLLRWGVDMKQRTLGYSLGTNSKLWSVLYPEQP